jgi:DNA (cytosine-5)-methyltransferase 1
MSSKKLLDLFCGVGGASMGYYLAGFDVVGVDINPQPDYPFEFIQADAFEVFATIGGRFDVVHASPPCQAYTWGTRKGREDKWPMYIEELREAFFETPYVIENVPAAPLEGHVIKLCGEMFGLDVIRHRKFESNIPIIQPVHKPHRGTVRDGTYLTVAGHGGDSKRYGLKDMQDAMNIDWTRDKQSIVEAIPPNYTEYVGNEIMRLLS